MLFSNEGFHIEKFLILGSYFVMFSVLLDLQPFSSSPHPPHPFPFLSPPFSPLSVHHSFDRSKYFQLLFSPDIRINL